MVKKLWSCLTDDLDHCMFTYSSTVERHHCFGGFNRTRSEKYGFIAPLRPDLHPNGAMANQELWQEVDKNLKVMCQQYYEDHYGTREEFIKEFGRNYINEDSRDKSESDSSPSEGWLQDIGF